jgi:hypothetical protein
MLLGDKAMKTICSIILLVALPSQAARVVPQLVPVPQPKMGGAAQPFAENPPLLTSQKPLDVRPENARTRIIQRNLFHPTRGVLPPSAEALAAHTNMPILLGTLVIPKHPSAMLRWGTQEARIVNEGEELEGCLIKKILSSRVQLQALYDGSTHWIDLDPVTSAGDTSATEMQALLALTGAKPAPGRPK